MSTLLQAALPGMPTALCPGLLVRCLPGAVAAAHGQPLAWVVSTGPATVRVRLCCDDATVRRVPRGLVRPAPAAVRAVADWAAGGPNPDVALAAEAAGEPAA